LSEPLVVNLVVNLTADDWLQVRCKELPGFLLSGKDHDAVYGDIVPSLKAFYLSLGLKEPSEQIAVPPLEVLLAVADAKRRGHPILTPVEPVRSTRPEYMRDKLGTTGQNTPPSVVNVQAFLLHG
jgi:hypothetical protein